jgi:hypothetical protein
VAAHLVGIGGAAQPAAAAPEDGTGRALRRLCAAEAARGEDGWCAAYLAGVSHTLAAFGGGGHPAGLCGFDGGRPDMLVDAFLSWAPPQSEIWDLPMFVSVQAALRAHWPCP